VASEVDGLLDDALERHHLLARQALRGAHVRLGEDHAHQVVDPHLLQLRRHVHWPPRLRLRQHRLHHVLYLNLPQHLHTCMHALVISDQRKIIIISHRGLEETEIEQVKVIFIILANFSYFGTNAQNFHNKTFRVNSIILSFYIPFIHSKMLYGTFHCAHRTKMHCGGNQRDNWQCEIWQYNGYCESASYLGEGDALGREELDGVDAAEALVVAAEGGEDDALEVEAERLAGGHEGARRERLVVVLEHLLRHGRRAHQHRGLAAHVDHRQRAVLLAQPRERPVRRLRVVHQVQVPDHRHPPFRTRRQVPPPPLPPHPRQHHHPHQHHHHPHQHRYQGPAHLHPHLSQV
jgi:hypothetical protein